MIVCFYELRREVEYCRLPSFFLLTSLDHLQQMLGREAHEKGVIRRIRLVRGLRRGRGTPARDQARPEARGNTVSRCAPHARVLWRTYTFHQSLASVPHIPRTTSKLPSRPPAHEPLAKKAR